MKLNRAVFRYVEHELYNYDATVQEIELMREDIIDEPPLKETIPSSGYTSDPTAKKATKLVTSTALTRMCRAVAAIDKALARLTENHRLLFSMKYRQDMPWQQVCIEMPTSERSYFRMRRELVEMVALELGLVAGSWQD